MSGGFTTTPDHEIQIGEIATAVLDSTVTKDVFDVADDAVLCHKLLEN
jgi:hypothetical protein